MKYPALFISLNIFLLISCGSTPAGKPTGQVKDLRYPVEAVTVQAEAVTFSIAAPGSVEAFETVSVTARVAGVADKVTFAIGDRITPDQVLVEIEPERYRLAVDQAKAGLAKTAATQADAESALKRREDANRSNPGLVRDEDIQTARTRVLAANADLAAARTAQAKAELDLRDALIHAPMAGIIQSRSVQTGQYVQVGMALATLLRRDPLQVGLQVSEVDAARLTMDSALTFTVSGGSRIHHAKIIHIAAAANAGSRMVAVRARIAEEDAARLRPGTFALCTVPVGGITVPVVPQIAVRPSERGFIAFVIDTQDGSIIARERVLQLGLRDHLGRVEVRSGLVPGERLVTRGAEALRDGVKIDLKEASEKPTEKPTEAPATSQTKAK